MPEKMRRALADEETAFLPAEEVSKKYEESIGYFADRKEDANCKGRGKIDRPRRK